ncbi:MAG: hypothetical protein ACLGI2_10400 [Acidimicrobiia bacterium]
MRRWPLPLCADLGLVDALAHLQLAARRAGGRIEVRGASPDLAGLLELVGLAGALAVEVGGEPEGGEEVGVQEVVVPDDPVA